jgi:hypothetical protein
MAFSDSFSAYDLSRMILEDQGVDRDQAIKALSLSGDLSEQVLAKKRAELDEQAAEAARVAHAASPAGRAEAAQAALDAEADRAAKVEGAKALIRADHGRVPEHLSDDEVLELAGLQAVPVERMSLQQKDEAALALAARWGSLTEMEKYEQARGIEDVSVMDRYVATMNGRGGEGQ